MYFPFKQMLCTLKTSHKAVIDVFLRSKWIVTVIHHARSRFITLCLCPCHCNFTNRRYFSSNQIVNVSVQHADSVVNILSGCLLETRQQAFKKWFTIDHCWQNKAWNHLSPFVCGMFTLPRLWWARTRSGQHLSQRINAGEWNMHIMTTWPAGIIRLSQLPHAPVIALCNWGETLCWL